MLAVQNTPTPLRMGTLHPFPTTERGRKKLLSRGALRPILPPTDGSTSEWRSWGSISHRCEMCQRGSYPRLHLLMNSYGGAYTFWRTCTACGHIDEEPFLSRQQVIETGRQLQGWCPVPAAASLLQRRQARADELQRKRETIASLQRRSPRPDSPPPPRGA